MHSPSQEPSHGRHHERRPRWRFLTNHARVIACIARDPSARLSDLADRVGITERAAQRIAAELVETGYLTRRRVGRRNRYTVHTELSLPDPDAQGAKLGEVLELLRRSGS